MHKSETQPADGDAADTTSAFLVGIQGPQCGPEECQDLLDELETLCGTLGLTVVGREMARPREPNPAFLIGSGKARELSDKARSLGAHTIIFDDPVSPSQQRNWEKLSDLAVIDRQEVILDIFAQHARTNEALLQVELARANYSLPRLKRRWTHLNRQRGMAGGMGMRGEGEQQIELDSRIVRMKIAKLKTQLAEVQRHREVQRLQRLRKPVPTAAIVGYTNAGKSSLLNAMTGAGVLVADKLFATLDPTVRKFGLPGGQTILLSDTVGFIRKLPHLLVEAFKSTLEETRLTDIIVEVLDISAPGMEERHDTTMNVLKEIGADYRNSLLVLNKFDKLVDETERLRVMRRFPEGIPCSALTGEGLAGLASELEKACVSSWIETELLIPHNRHDALARIREAGSIISESYQEDGAHIHMRIPKAAWPLAMPFAVNSPDHT